MRFASLGSGSGGNALLVEAQGTLLMIDCGLGVAEVSTRMARLGVGPGDLDALVLTHEHGDHAGGAAALARRHRLPVWLTHGTWAAVPALATLPGLQRIEGFRPFQVGALTVSPYPVPHDAREPAQFVVGNGARRLGLLTDAGHVTAHMRRCLAGVDALVLEFNHDETLLRDGAYPAQLKRRIAGDYGHLGNAAAAQLLAQLRPQRMQHVVAAHLSESNNRPDLVLASMAQATGLDPERFTVATQADGFGWLPLDGDDGH